MSAEPDGPVPEAEIERPVRTARIAAWALLSGLLAFLALEEFVRARFRPFLGFAHPRDRLALRYSVYLAAAAAIVLIRVLNAVLLRRRKAGPPASALLRRLLIVSLATMALAEVPALLGLALFLLGGYNVDFYMLLFVSLVLLFMYFPRRRAFEAHLRNAPADCPF
jgi:hypothetical protein